MFEMIDPGDGDQPVDPDLCPFSDFDAMDGSYDGPAPDDDEPFDERDLDPASVDDCLGELTAATLELAATQAAHSIEQIHSRTLVDELGDGLTLDELGRTVSVCRRSQARQLALVTHWADLNAVPDPHSAGRRGGDQLIEPGGDGTPAVAEFALAELGTRLGVSLGAAVILTADALDLRHRLPRLWSRVLAGDVEVWVARKTAQQTRPLTHDACAVVDRAVADLAGTVPPGRYLTRLDAEILLADPERATTETERAKAERGVWASRGVDHGHKRLFGKAAAGDVDAFDEALDVVAHALKILGDDDDPQARRSKALGILADPQLAHDVVTRAAEAREAAAAAAAQRRAGVDGPDPMDEIESRRLTFGTNLLYLHLTAATLLAILRRGPETTGIGVARVEGIGPVIADLIREWLTGANVTVVPVLDPESMPPVDRHEVPDRMSEAVGLVKPADCFPFSANTSRTMDDDHTTSWHEHGPPGQTAVATLAKLGRRNHRVKTHGRWTVSQPRSGTWIWRDPHGHHYLVDGQGTLALGKLG